MAKHPRKKQKTSKDDKPPVRALGIEALTDDAQKDDEERMLESMLFGTEFVPRDAEGGEGDDEEANDDDADEGGREMGHLMDSDLFFVDEGEDGPSIPQYGSEEEPEGSDEEDSGSDSSSTAGPSQPKPTTSKPPAFPLKSRKPPAWTDPTDNSVSVSIASNPRLRKLRDAADEDTISGKDYETRLRRQYEKINPEPEWAKKARKTAREVDADQDESSEGGIQSLLSSTSGILSSGKRRTKTGHVVLPKGTISIERLRDANQSVQSANSGAVKVVTFHPSDKVPVLCVGTADRRIRLFNTDGHTNPLLQTLHLPSLPLTSPTSALFHPLGTSLLLTGPRPYFYTHDLQSGNTSRHARGLWGTTFNSINDTTTSVRSRKRGGGGGGDENNKGGGGGGEGLELTSFSPYPGSLLAVAGRGGYVHLVDWKSGAGQVVGSLKCGGGGGGVKALWWPDASTGVNALGAGSGVVADGGAMGGNGGRQHLAVLSGDAEVYLWDVGERRCVRRWKDEGGFRGAGRTMSGVSSGPNGGYLAIGSNSGYVNMYPSSSFSPPLSTEDDKNPQPTKQIGNLTTPISSIRFNHDGQLMAIASQEKKDGMRLIHTPTLSAFSNWPTSSTPLGHVTAVDFSPRINYMAIGNTRGRVLLWHLKDYGGA